MASGPITSWEIDGETVERVADFIFGDPKLLQMVIKSMKLRHLLHGKKVMTNLDSRDIANKCLASQSYGFSSSHIWM